MSNVIQTYSYMNEHTNSPLKESLIQLETIIGYNSFSPLFYFSVQKSESLFLIMIIIYYIIGFTKSTIEYWRQISKSKGGLC